MKLYNSILAIAAISASLCMSSCSDWLDYTPKDQQTEAEQFDDLQGFKESLNGVYSLMTSSSLYGQDLSFGAVDVLGLLYKINQSNSSWYDFAYYRNTKASSTVAARMSSTWSQAYKTILNVNMVLSKAEELKGVSIKDDDYKLIAGELYGIRAMIHFDLLRLFGPIYEANPDDLSIVYNTSCTGERNERIAASEVIKKLLEDVEKAQSLLEGVDPVITDGPLASDGGDEGNWKRYRQLRFNYYAATLLKARICMWAGDYSTALTEAKKIADNETVQANFPNVVASKLLGNTVNPDRAFSTETLFGFYHKTMATNIYGAYFNSENVQAQYVWQPRSTSNYMTELFAEEGDYRRQSQWITAANGQANAFDFIKYQSFTPTNSDNPEFYATYFPLMRKTEADYIAAECLMRQDDIAGGIEYLNKVRTARGVLTPLDASTITKLDDAILEVTFEYLREFRGEGQIYFHFKRLQQPVGTYDNYYVDNTKNNTRWKSLNGFESANYSLKVYGSYTAIQIPAAELN